MADTTEDFTKGSVPGESADTVIPISGKKHIKIKLKALWGQDSYEAMQCYEGFGAFVRGSEY